MSFECYIWNSWTCCKKIVGQDTKKDQNKYSKGLFDNIVCIFWKYVWGKMCVKIRVILLKNWKMLLKMSYQTTPKWERCRVWKWGFWFLSVGKRRVRDCRVWKYGLTLNPILFLPFIHFPAAKWVQWKPNKNPQLSYWLIEPRGRNLQHIKTWSLRWIQSLKKKNKIMIWVFFFFFFGW